MTMQIKHIYSLAFCIIILTNCALKGIERPLGRQDSTGTPHLIKQGTATQLVVDGQLDSRSQTERRCNYAGLPFGPYGRGKQIGRRTSAPGKQHGH